MDIRASVFTQEALKLKKWNYLEWFGLDTPYMPYCMADDYAMAYGESDGNADVSIEVYDSFSYVNVYLEGEFLASFEFPFLTNTGQIINIKNFSLDTLKDRLCRYGT